MGGIGEIRNLPTPCRQRSLREIRQGRLESLKSGQPPGRFFGKSVTELINGHCGYTATRKVKRRGRRDCRDWKRKKPPLSLFSAHSAFQNNSHEIKIPSRPQRWTPWHHNASFLPGRSADLHDQGGQRVWRLRLHAPRLGAHLLRQPPRT